MIVGDPSVFAIESAITEAYERPGLRALGYFVLHVDGRRYGKAGPKSTLLACSFDEVARRIMRRGTHTAPFSGADGGALAVALRRSLYSPSPATTSHFGIEEGDLAAIFTSRNLVWAPDGDAAFDDRSFVLQFDVDDRVRVVAFQADEDYGYSVDSLRDAWLEADRFYDLLQRWRDAFQIEWSDMPKVPIA